jgi:phosphatidylglycerol:prolipoprotein diacylglycerol transferase
LGRKYQQKLFPGEIFLIYLVIYPFGRFLLEFIRLDSSMIGILNINQFVMGSIALLSLSLLGKKIFGNQKEYKNS